MLIQEKKQQPTKMKYLKLSGWRTSQWMFLLFLAISFKSISTNGGNKTNFEQAESVISEERFLANSSNKSLNISSLLNVPSAATSANVKSRITSQQPSTFAQVQQHLSENLIKSNLSQSILEKNFIENISQSRIAGDELLNSLPNTSTNASFNIELDNESNMNLVQTERKKDTIHPCTTASSNSDMKNVCIEEDCVIAAATVLSSLDRSVNPCENFYDFACGGWIENALDTSTDRFQMIDKRNRNRLQNILEQNEPKFDNGSNPKTSNTAKEKARAFYRSCVDDKEVNEKENIQDLLNIIIEAGGSSIRALKLNSLHEDKPSFDERVQVLHNNLGLNVLFTWGVIDLEGQNRLAIINGGFNLGLLEESFNREEYLKIMMRIINLLVEAQDEDVIIDLDYDDDMSHTFNNTNFNNSNSSMYNITYEYEEISDEYNSSYEYKDDPGNTNTAMSSSLGNTLLGFIKKPIEWFVPTSHSNTTMARPETMNSSNSLNPETINATYKSSRSPSALVNENQSLNSFYYDNKIGLSLEKKESKPQNKLNIPKHHASLLRPHPNGQQL